MTQSQAAFRMSARTLFENSNNVYFWTFTFPRKYNIWEASSAFNPISKKIKNEYGRIQGLRAMEWHETGHGLHHHVLVNKYLKIRAIKEYARRCGFGRIHVREADKGAVDYIANYLGKQHSNFHGCHQWATLGKGWATTKNGVFLDSDAANAMRACYRYYKNANLTKAELWSLMETAKMQALANTDKTQVWSPGGINVRPSSKRSTVETQLYAIM